jgi:hypothetical protein
VESGTDSCALIELLVEYFDKGLNVKNEESMLIISNIDRFNILLRNMA